MCRRSEPRLSGGRPLVSSVTQTRFADVVVIGDGIIGLSTALELGDAGVTSCVIGAWRPGVASIAAAGILAPDGAQAPSEARPFYIASPSYCQQLVRRVNAFDPELHIIERMIEVLGEDGASDGASLIPADELLTTEPALAAPHGALMHAQSGAVDNVRLVGAVEAALRRSEAVSFVRDDPAASVRVTASGASVTTASGATVEGGFVVLAAGAWATRIEGLPRVLPVEPLKGQMLSVGARVVSHAVMAPGVYLVPRGDETLIGASVEHAGFDVETTAPELDALQHAAIALCPALASAPVTRRWAGLRPATPDLMPIIGPDPEADRLLYACGHSKNGILLAAITAAMIRRIVCREPLPYSIRPFSAERFR